MLSLSQMAVLEVNVQKQFAQLQEQELHLQVQSMVHNEEVIGLKKVVAMPHEEEQRENLILMKKGYLLSPIRRMKKYVGTRKRQLQAMGFQPIKHLTEVPNTRYLWKSLLATLRKHGLVLFSMDVDKKTKKNIQCYRLSEILDPSKVIQDMNLMQQQGDWIREVLSAQQNSDKMAVPMEAEDTQEVTEGNTNEC